VRTAVLAALLLSGSHTAAQALSGAISGAVRAPQGRPSPEPRSWLTRSAQLERKTLTNDQGRYRLAGLPPRDYEVRAAADG